MGKIKEEIVQALQNATGKSVTASDYSTTADALRAFNLLYTCVVTFTLATTGATLVVKKAGVVVAPETDGTYALKEGSYTYDVTKAGYTGKLAQALTITNAEETSGTKAVSVAALSTCVVTFALTPAGAVVVVKKGTETLTAEQDGTYLMPLGDYTYSVSADGYTAVEDVEVTIASGDETTGTKTITVVLEAAGG